ncbi:MAG TPA: hypothetical protein ENN38_02490 [Actinobacteria bacterium]|nr:hypothetical protein [Actinomycetota bacterium]
MNNPKLSPIEKMIRSAEEEIGTKNIVGVGFGPKIVEGEVKEEKSLRYYVEKKLPIDELPKINIIPKIISISTFGLRKFKKEKEILTDVIEIGKVEAFVYPSMAYREKIRPAPGGVSVGHKKVGAGTLGAIVRDKKTGKKLILSNNHVLANENRAKKNDPIIQPGILDNGHKRKDVIAKLLRWVEVDFYNPNTVDAAVAEPLGDDLVEETILDIGKVGGVTKARVGMIIQKTGRTTGHTYGEVLDTKASIRIHYDKGVPLFRNQILTTFMSQPGDSGSLVLTRDKKACGLLFAGSDIISIHNHIEEVFKQLDIEIYVDYENIDG